MRSEEFCLGADGWVAGLVDAFPAETVAIFRLAKAGRIEEGGGPGRIAPGHCMAGGAVVLRVSHGAGGRAGGAAPRGSPNIT